MKLGLGLVSAWVLGACAIVACSGGGQADPVQSASSDSATLVAALSVNSDGSDTTWADPASDPEPVHSNGCGFGAIEHQIALRFDADGNGKLDATERAALRAAFAEPASADGADAGAPAADAGARGEGHRGHGIRGRIALLASLYDTNGDGSLDATEIAALKADIEARCQARLDKLVAEFDTNGDGTLDADEWQAAVDALHTRFEKRHDARVKVFDQDGDGRLNPGERGHAQDDADDLRDQAQQAFDADGDGQLDDGEQRNFAEHGRECVRGDRPIMSTDDGAADTDDATDTTDTTDQGRGADDQPRGAAGAPADRNRNRGRGAGGAAATGGTGGAAADAP